MPDGAWIRGRNIQLLPPGLALNQSDGLSRSTLQMPGPTCSESASVCRCPGYDWHANHHSDFRFANTAFMTWHTVLRHQTIAVPPELPPMHTNAATAFSARRPLQQDPDTRSSEWRRPWNETSTSAKQGRPAPHIRIPCCDFCRKCTDVRIEQHHYYYTFLTSYDSPSSP